MKLPSGFSYSGVPAGIKKKPNARDVVIIASDVRCTIAGVFTTNQVVAAPVVISRQRCPSANGRGVVINSGNANACTGDAGFANALQMCSWAASALGRMQNEIIDDDQFLVMSTGIIGHQLPMEKIDFGIRQAAQTMGDSEDSFLSASDGIMTTDATRKIADRELKIGDATYSIVAMAKGAGMIGPSMATMLGLIVTDIPLPPDTAQKFLQYAADRSFNCVSVEGHTSTNDSLVLMAAKPQRDDLFNPEELTTIRDCLAGICIDLAKMIPDDGEGATHLIEIVVDGARCDKDADTIARSVAMSNLVKTAIYGGDPNWGRIVSAVGYAGVPIRTESLALILNGHKIFDVGQPVAFDPKIVSASIKGNRNTRVELMVGFGSGTATHWTSDLGCAYVEFNSEYST